MSQLYGPQHRALQDQFDSRRLADNTEQKVVVGILDAAAKAFIESCDMFWLATVDHRGRPTVSYKGGEPGFVRALDDKTLAFPCYDGNGMFYSMGNIKGNAEIGLLFVDFERPKRLRVQGTASIAERDPLLNQFIEAQLVVRVAISEVFRNCPRYVHRYTKLEQSKYVPQPGITTPLPGWKHIDDVQAALPPKDRGRAAREGGLRTRDQHLALIAEDKSED